MKPETRTKAVLGLVASALTATAILLGGPTGLEGTRTTAYLDSAGVPTLCTGHTAGVKIGDTALAAQCRVWLTEDLRKAQAPVDRCVAGPVTVNEYIALLSFTFNVGGQAMCNSTAVKLFNKGDHTAGCDALGLWNKITVKGKLVKSSGLVNRRDVEIAICKTPSKDMIT